MNICEQRFTAWHPQAVNDSETLAEVFRFRERVWRATGGIAADAFADGSWQDEWDADGTHWVIRDEAFQIVASARSTVHENILSVPKAEEYLRYGCLPSGRIASPARVVVDPGCQGRGLGKRLLTVQDEHAVASGAAHAVRQASPAMVRLLAPRGWRLLGPARPDSRFPGVEFQVASLNLMQAFDQTMRFPESRRMVGITGLPLPCDCPNSSAFHEAGPFHA